MQNNIVEFKNLLFDLVRLRYDYDTGIEQMIDGFEITSDSFLKNHWLQQLASKKTLMLLEQFRYQWINMLKTKAYSSIGSYMQLDKDWIRLCNKDLLEVIKSIKDDMNRNEIKIDFPISFENVSIKVNEEQILNIAEKGIKLLIKENTQINPYYTNE